MNTLLEIAARNAISACLLAGVVLALCLIIRRPAIRNALWLIVLIRLVLPPVWTVPVPGLKAPSSPVQKSTAPIATDMQGLDATAPSELEKPSIASRIGQWLLPSLLGLWAVGTVVIVVITVRRMGRFQRGLSDAVLAPAESQRQAEEIARTLGLKKCPAIWLVNGRVPPMLWMPGILARQARLIFPMDLFFAMDNDKRAALIAHELAHLRRRDPWVRWLEISTVALYWWHPLLGFIRRRLRETEEQCCDELVITKVRSRKAYASALVETVIFLDGPENESVPGLASGASPMHDLKQRVSMILRGAPKAQLPRMGTLALLFVAIAALGIGPAFSQEAQREDAESNAIEQTSPATNDAANPPQAPEQSGPGSQDVQTASPLPVESRRDNPAKPPLGAGKEGANVKPRVGASFLTKNNGN